MLDVALNPAVLQESKKDKTEVYMLALSFVQQHHGMRLSQQYTVVSCGPKSSPDDLHRRLGVRQWTNTSKQPDTGRAISLVPDKLLQALYIGAISLCCCRCTIFHLLPQFLIIHSVPFYSQSDPSCPSAADLLPTLRETRAGPGSPNYL